MKTLPTALQSHLDSGTTTLAWCWRLTQASPGTAMLGFTDHDLPLTFDGTTFDPETGLTSSQIQNASDMSVDAQDAMGALRSDKITEADIARGAWDSATVELWRVNWADVSQRYLLRRGLIGQVRRGDAAFVAEVRSQTALLANPEGRTYQTPCDAVLGDSRCNVDLTTTANKGSATVAAVEDAHVFTTNGLGSFASAWFEYGLLTWTSGVLAGQVYEVQQHELRASDVRLTVLGKVPELPGVGDGFDIIAGCDKFEATCIQKFANVINFRGFAHIPSRSTTYVASATGSNDGSVL